ncbi:MAG: hypothetical protein MJ071_01170 [Oscillospiraceae bacterium]|nr:hypothetical protein [Oscillospiraceae bacterium]
MNRFTALLRKYFPLMVFCAASFWLFYQIYPIIFATHDDMVHYTVAKSGHLWREAFEAAKRSRISQLWNYFLVSVPFFGDKVWFYKAIAYATFWFDIFSGWLLLKNHVSRSFADLSAILVVSWACISNYHNLLISYAFCHQLPIAFLFLSLNAYGNYLKDNSRKAVIRSAVYLLLACMIYEAFVAALLLFAVWAMIDEGKRQHKSYFSFLQKASRKILPQLSLLSVYLIIYYGWRILYPTQYDGVTVSFKEPFMSMATALFYGISFFPVTAIMDYAKNNVIGLKEVWHALSLPAWIVSGLTAGVFGVLLPKIKIGKEKMTRLSILSFLGIFVPVLVISLSEKYPEWVRVRAIGYLPSYYSYFFLVAFLLTVMVRLYHSFSERYNQRTVHGILVAGVFCITLTANVVTSLWRPFFDVLSLRYRNFDYVVSSDTAMALDEEWQYYAPDNPGIHSNSYYTMKYLQLYNPSEVTFWSKEEQLQDEKRIFCVRMPISYSWAVMGEVDTDLCTDALQVRTLVPDALQILLYDAEGQRVVFADVHDGDVLEAPAGTKFDLHTRPEMIS